MEVCPITFYLLYPFRHQRVFCEVCAEEKLYSPQEYNQDETASSNHDLQSLPSTRPLSASESISRKYLLNIILFFGEGFRPDAAERFKLLISKAGGTLSEECTPGVTYLVTSGNSLSYK